MSTNAAHKRWWQIFEVIFGVPYFAGIGLQLAAPVVRPRGCMHSSSSWEALSSSFWA